VGLRLWLVCVIMAIGTPLYLGGLLGWSLLVVFLLTVLYEFIKSLSKKYPRRAQLFAWSLFIAVGFGYALRGVVGFWLGTYAPTEWDSSTNLLWSYFADLQVVSVILFFSLFGSVFVVMTWVLESFSFLIAPVTAGEGPSAKHASYLASLNAHGHLRYLLKSHRVNLQEPGLQSFPTGIRAGKTWGAYQMPMLNCHYFFRPEVIMGCLAFTATAAVTGAITNLSYLATLVLAACWVCLGAVILVGRKLQLWIALAVGVVVGLVINAISIGLYLSSGILTVCMWLVPAFTLLVFRTSSYRSLKYGVTAMPKAAIAWMGLLAILAIGKEAGRALRLRDKEALKELKVEADRAIHGDSPRPSME